MYRRSEGRYKARSVGKMAANLCGLLMGDLEATRGKKQLVTAASAGGGENQEGGVEEAWGKKQLVTAASAKGEKRKAGSSLCFMLRGSWGA